MLFIGFLIVQRLAELAIAKRNTARLRARGAVEHGAGHYGTIVALHASWIAAIAVWGWDEPVRLGWLVPFAILQALRAWVLATLGPRWTTRILVVPGETLVAQGPFRWIPHPNYAVVVAEMVVAPMVLGLWWVALVWGVANVALLALVRIPAEERALGLR
nr:isoprenylcysteine carboxylmethyltransferase family protein [Jannaschia sp. Os4]